MPGFWYKSKSTLDFNLIKQAMVFGVRDEMRKVCSIILILSFINLLFHLILQPNLKHAKVAELVDAHDSKSCSFGSVGSIPTFGTPNPC